MIGAPNDFLPGSTPGYVRLAEWDGARWVPASVDVRLGADVDPAGSDLFGYSVGLSGDGTRVAIGALGPERAAGLVRVVGLHSLLRHHDRRSHDNKHDSRVNVAHEQSAGVDDPRPRRTPRDRGHRNGN